MAMSARVASGASRTLAPGPAFAASAGWPAPPCDLQPSARTSAPKECPRGHEKPAGRASASTDRIDVSVDGICAGGTCSPALFWPAGCAPICGGPLDPDGREVAVPNLLLVEDDDETRSALADFLSAEGYMICEAHDG